MRAKLVREFLNESVNSDAQSIYDNMPARINASNTTTYSNEKTWSKNSDHFNEIFTPLFNALGIDAKFYYSSRYIGLRAGYDTEKQILVCKQGESLYKDDIAGLINQWYGVGLDAPKNTDTTDYEGIREEITLGAYYLVQKEDNEDVIEEFKQKSGYDLDDLTDPDYLKSLDAEQLHDIMEYLGEYHAV